MKLSDILAQFKTIEPDAQFSQRSKREILVSPQTEPGMMRGVFIFLHVLETGAAVALAGFFILILTGSFSPTRSISPIQYSVIDPQGLHAEAQAIDMQIQLADVEYPQETSTLMTQSTTPAPTAMKNTFAAALGVTATSSSLAPASAPSSTATTTALSVDTALQQLSH